MKRRTDDEAEAAAEQYDGPSKSQRKRDASALQDLGVALTALPEAELDLLPLPEKLRDAIDLAKRITSHGALFRQRQFIGKLMRNIDTAPIQVALDAKIEAQAEAARHFHRLERWRDRLIDEGDEALGAFIARYPAADGGQLRRLASAARAERQEAIAKTAQRALFKTIRAAAEASAATGEDLPPDTSGSNAASDNEGDA